MPSPRVYMRGGLKVGAQASSAALSLTLHLCCTAGRLGGKEGHLLVLVCLPDKSCAQPPTRTVLQVS